MTLRWLTATTMLRWLTATTMRRWSTAHVLFPCFVIALLVQVEEPKRGQKRSRLARGSKFLQVPKACLSPCPGASNLPQDSYICVLASLFVQYLRDEGQRIQHDKRMDLERFWKEDFARACPMYATCARLLRQSIPCINTGVWNIFNLSLRIINWGNLWGQEEYLMLSWKME